MGIILESKTIAIHVEAEVAAKAEAIFPVKLLLATLRPYPGLIVLVAGLGLLCGAIGHIV